MVSYFTDISFLTDNDVYFVPGPLMEAAGVRQDSAVRVLKGRRAAGQFVLYRLPASGRFGIGRVIRDDRGKLCIADDRGEVPSEIELFGEVTGYAPISDIVDGEISAVEFRSLRDHTICNWWPDVIY